MTFKEYLESKNIDPRKFALKEREKFMELKSIFEQMSATNFTQQKLFLINPIRRKYPWSGDLKEKKPKYLSKVKPKIKPRI